VGGAPFDLQFEIYGSMIHGTYRFEKEGTQYTLEFDMEEVQIEGSPLGQWLIFLLTGVPKISVEGNFLKEMGSSVVNALGRFMSLETVYSTAPVRIPGLQVRGNDLLYRFQPGQMPWWIRFLLRLGLYVRIVPEGKRLRVETHYRRG